MSRCAVVLRSRFQNGMVVAWHGRALACVTQTRPHCVNQMGKTRSKPFLARYGRGTAWARRGTSMVCVNWPLVNSGPLIVKAVMVLVAGLCMSLQHNMTCRWTSLHIHVREMRIKAATDVITQSNLSCMKGWRLGVSRTPPHLPHHGVYIHIWREPELCLLT
jgi:hypothetical protein